MLGQKTMEKEILKKFVNQLQSFKTTKEVESFLSSILTPGELLEIPMRLEIVRMLKAGSTHRQISDKLGVGIATVARGSRELKMGNFKDI
jgi:TrpR family transcriptional regulator, trp operon repressor